VWDEIKVMNEESIEFKRLVLIVKMSNDDKKSEERSQDLDETSA